MALFYKLHSFTPTFNNLQLMLTLMVRLFRMAPSNMRPSSWCAVFVTWDDRCAGAWAGTRARAGASKLAGDGAWAGVGARAGAATLTGDGAWAGVGARAGAATLAGDGAWAGVGARAGAATLTGDGAWAGVGARAGAATLAGDGAWAGVRARAGAAMLAGDGAWVADAGTAGLQYLNRLCCAGDLVTGGGERATRGVSQSTSMTCKIQ